jgi:glycosyl transferase family 87
MRFPRDVAWVVDELRRGAWLTRRRVTEYAVILLALEIAALLFFAAGSHGLIVPLDRPNASDFVSFYAAGSLADAGTPWLAYDASAHFAAEAAATEPGIAYNYFFYPPVYLLLCAPLARLPYLAALAVFETGTLGAYLYMARRLAAEYGAAALLVLVAFPAVFWTIGTGQNAFLTAALFGAGTMLLDRRPILAGLLLGALCYKPHFGLLIPIALAAGRHGRAFGAAAVSVLGLVALSAFLFGAETWQAYIAAAASSHAVYETDLVDIGGFANPFGFVIVLGGEPSLAYAVQAAAALLCAGFVGFVWTRGLSLPVRAASLIASTIVAVPLVLFYDLMLGAVAMLWLVRAGRANGFGDWEKSLLALLYMLPLVSGHLGPHWHPMTPPLFAALLLGLTVLAARREIAQSAAMGKMATQ